VFSYDCSLCNEQRMARRNDDDIAAALQAMAQAVGQQPNAVGNDGVRMLETFLRNHPPTFKGRYDPDGAQTWLKEVERIFRVMQCNEAQMARICWLRRLMIVG